MTDRIDAPRKILAVTDTSADHLALETAMALAEAHGAALEVMACVELPRDLVILSRLTGEDPDRLVEEAVEHTRNEIQMHLSDIMPERQVPLEVAVGKTYLEIIRHVAKAGCDFVVKNAEPLSQKHRFLFTSTDQHLLRKCPCPVWLQTPKAPSSPKRVLAAVDLDVRDAAEPETLIALNRRVVETACNIANGPDAEVVVLHAWEAVGEGLVWAFSSSDDARSAADKYVNEILNNRNEEMLRFLASIEKTDGAGPRIISRLARGTPEQVIQEQNQKLATDAVVMGTVARIGLHGVFIGNTAENIINSLDCPVVAVKPDGFVSPLL